MSRHNGNRNIILSKMKEGKWYTSDEIIELTNLTKTQVHSAMQCMFKVEMLEAVNNPYRPSTKMYRKPVGATFGVSNRLQEYYQHMRGAHAV